MEGYEDAGITHYTGNRSGSLFRECLQNSMDAASSKTVNVSIEKKRLRVDQIAGLDLANHLDGSAIFLDKNRPDVADRFRKAAEMLRNGGQIECLSIHDENTTGTIDKGDDPDLTPWVALTRGSGLSVKANRQALGLFGIGKNAPFAHTPLRTVLYATCYEDNGNHSRRMAGRAILTTHEIKHGSLAQRYGARGYLGNASNQPRGLADNDIPEGIFRLKYPGTRVLILDYTYDGETEQWAKDIKSQIADNFFYAIINDRLNVIVLTDSEEFTIDKISLKESAVDKATRRYIEICEDPHYLTTTKHIESIGEVSLYLSVGPEEPYTRSLALVRSPGLMLTNKRTNFGEAEPPPFPRHWEKFTAVVVCKSISEEDWIIKDCENPAHDQISVEQIEDKSRRVIAKKSLKQLGQWLHDEISKHANLKRQESTTDSPLLRDIGLYVSDTTTEGGRGISIRQSRVSRRAQSRPKVELEDNIQEEVKPGPPNDEPVYITPTPNPDPPPEPPPEPPPDPPPPKPKPSPKSISRPKIDLNPILRPLLSSDGISETYSIIASFEVPSTLDQFTDGIRAELRTSGEDGGGMRVPISAAIALDGISGITAEQGRLVIPNSCFKAGRIEVQFRTAIPVENAAYTLIIEQL